MNAFALDARCQGSGKQDLLQIYVCRCRSSITVHPTASWFKTSLDLRWKRKWRGSRGCDGRYIFTRVAYSISFSMIGRKYSLKIRITSMNNIKKIDIKKYSWNTYIYGQNRIYVLVYIYCLHLFSTHFFSRSDGSQKLRRKPARSMLKQHRCTVIYQYEESP